MAANVKPQVDEAQKKLDLKNKVYSAVLETSKGNIHLKFLPDVAPGHVANFLALAQIGFYNGVGFHRIIKGFMQIKAEFNSTSHEPGVLSMARTDDPNTAGSQFFICLEKVPHLDRKYTAFGKVADEASLAVVRTIGGTKTGPGDKPLEKIVINKVTVTEKPK